MITHLRESLRAYKQTLITAITIVLLIVGIFNIYTSVAINKTSNDECLWVPHKNLDGSVVLVFDNVKIGGVTYEAGIRDGDTLLQINGKKLTGTIQAQLILNSVAEGKRASYLVAGKSGSYETQVYVKKMFNIGDLAFCLLGVIWLLVSFMSLTANPEGKAQKLFFLIGILLVINKINVLLPMYGFNILDPQYLGFIILWSFSSLFLPIVFLHFFLVFPSRVKLLDKKWFRVSLYVVPLLIYFVYYLYVFLNPNILKSLQSGLNALFVPVNVLFVVALNSSLITLAVKYKRMPKGSLQRKSTLIILSSFIIGLMGIIYVSFFAPLVADIVFNAPEHYTPVILIVLIPIAFGYSILKYQLLDVSVVVKNTVIYGFATATLAILYFLSVYVIGQAIGGIVGNDYQNFVAAVSFLLFAMVFQSTKDKFQEILTRRFYPEQFAYQKILIQLSKELNGSIEYSYNHILDSITETFTELLKVQKFGVLLSESKTNGFKLVRHKNLNGSLNLNEWTDIKFDFLNRSLSNSDLVANEVFKKNFPKFCEQLNSEEVYTVIPMIVNSKLIGLILLGLKISGSKFSLKEIELLNAVGSQAAVSIENSRLYQSETEKLRLERDLDLARKIQETLVPKNIPLFEDVEISGKMLPAMQVGGDYFDIIKVSEKKIFVVVGDVSGKGLSASLYMTKLQTFINLYCHQYQNPLDIMYELNRQIYKSFERHWFITLTLALFDLEKGIVEVCRAGHVPLLVSNAGNINLIQSKGLGLGLDKGELFEKTLEIERIQLNSGEVFLFYSDGITEMMNENGEFFGTDNLVSVFRVNRHQPSDKILNSIISSINTFRGLQEQADDVTCVVVKVK
ncbi:MAG TPA: SpoIIE family protein phosphatase [Ignavibacteriaceae bacterium]|nr:SpoIIE family protein phosphatase [Ignavibacteriaceae bacterium]